VARITPAHRPAAIHRSILPPFISPQAGCFSEYPVAALAVIDRRAGLALGAYQPAASVVAQGCTSHPTATTGLAGQSALREPELRFYSTQAGFAWAAAWEQSRDPATLAKARHYLKQGLIEEANLLQIWARLAVIDWLAAEPDLAQQHMEIARQLSPRAPSYTLNAAWFMEHIVQLYQAHANYLQTLDIALAWANHPFWETSGVCHIVLQEWAANNSTTSPKNEKGNPYWILAKKAVENNDSAEARRLLVYSKWV
jgi:hypothetical protein